MNFKMTIRPMKSSETINPSSAKKSRNDRQINRFIIGV